MIQTFCNGDMILLYSAQHRAKHQSPSHLQELRVHGEPERNLSSSLEKLTQCARYFNKVRDKVLRGPQGGAAGN